MKKLTCTIALSTCFASGAAFANCGDIVQFDYAPVVGSSPAFAAEILSSSPECFGGGATTSLVQMNGTMFQQALAVSSVLAGRRLADGPSAKVAGSFRGAAAGGQAGPFNVWASLNQNDSKQDYASFGTYAAPGSRSKNDTDILNTVLGVDYALNPALVVGVSLAIDRGDGSGGNTDPSFDLNTLKSKGHVFAPYVGWQLNREFSLDASVGYGSGEISTSTSQHSNRSDSDRRFAAANLNYMRWLGDMQFSGRASYLHGVEKYDDIRVNGTSQAGTGARNTIDQVRLGAQVSWWRAGFAPFVSLGYTNDIDRKTTQFGAPANPIGDDAWVWGVGVNFYSLAAGVTGAITYNREEGRSNQKNDSLTANINVRF